MSIHFSLFSSWSVDIWKDLSQHTELAAPGEAMLVISSHTTCCFLKGRSVILERLNKPVVSYLDLRSEDWRKHPWSISHEVLHFWLRQLPFFSYEGLFLFFTWPCQVINSNDNQVTLCWPNFKLLFRDWRKLIINTQKINELLADF